MSRIRQAVIMVGGLGTRLRPLTETRPKPAMPVLDKPFLKYLIESMSKAGVEEVILACGYKSANLASAIGNGDDLGVKITYSDEEKPLGTGGAIKNIESVLDDNFLAANGDTLNYMNVTKLIDRHFSSGAQVTISVGEVEDPSSYGVIRMDDSGRILEFQDKPPKEKAISNFVNSGVYAVRKNVLDFIPKDTFYDFSKDLFPLLLEKGEKIVGHPIEGIYIDIGKPSDLIRMNVTMAKEIYPNKDWNSIAKDSTVSGSSYIGNNASVSKQELNDAIISEGSSVSNSKIINSLIMKNCNVRNATITDSVLGEGCVVDGKKIEKEVLGDGTKL